MFWTGVRWHEASAAAEADNPIILKNPRRSYVISSVMNVPLMAARAVCGWPEPVFRCRVATMAVQAKTHAHVLDLVNASHCFDRTVARLATDSPRFDMPGVVKEGMIRKAMHSNPCDRLAGIHCLADFHHLR